MEVYRRSKETWDEKMRKAMPSPTQQRVELVKSKKEKATSQEN